MEPWQIILGSGVAVVAVIELFGKLIIWNKEREATLEDKSDEESNAIQNLTKSLNDYMLVDKERADNIQADIKKVSEDLKDIKEKQKAQTFALQTSIQNTILHSGAEAIRNGQISVEEFARLQKLADGAKAVGADGVVTATMNALEKIIG